MPQVRSDRRRVVVPKFLAERSTPEEVEGLIAVNETLKKVLRWCLFNLGPAAKYEDAEDVVQEFWSARLPRVIAGYRHGSQSVGRYTGVCLQRFCWKRRKKLLERLESEQPFAAFSQNGDRGDEAVSKTLAIRSGAMREKHEDRHALAEDLRVAIATLSPDDQEILQLHWDKGLDDSEIAADLDINGNAVRQRRHRAQKRLKHRLNSMWGDQT